MFNNVIFLDIDGPMIPGKAAFLPNQTFVHSIFDPCATAMLLRLIEQSDARIVIASIHGLKGRQHVEQMFEINGIDSKLLHRDWVTPTDPMRRRVPEIKSWLDAHPDITSYVVIDDEQISVDVIPNSVQCDTYEGFSFRNYLECCVFLDAFTGTSEEIDRKRREALTMIQSLKRKEICRTVRCGEPNQFRVWEISHTQFPSVTNV